MTAEQFISIIRSRLGGRRYHEEVIRFAIGRAYSIFMSEQDDLTPYRKDYGGVSVLQDSTTEKYYSMLPGKPLNIEDAVRITTKKGLNITFEPIQDGQAEVYADMEVGKISSVIGYKIRTDKVWYENMPDGIDSVRMHIVIPFEEYDYTDEFYLPVGADELMIETTTNYLLGKIPQSDINDGSELT